MTFYCAMGETEAAVWQDGEQAAMPLAFQPTFVCEWDGVSESVTVVYGALATVPEQTITDEEGNSVIIPAHAEVIPFAGWPDNQPIVDQF